MYSAALRDKPLPAGYIPRLTGKHFETLHIGGAHSLLFQSYYVLYILYQYYLRANSAPCKGKNPAYPLGRYCPLDGKKPAPVRDLQKDAVCLIPALTDAGNQSGIFQLPQGGLDRPLIPVKIVCHLLDRIDHIHIPVLGHPAAFLGKRSAVEQKPYSSLALMEYSPASMKRGQGNRTAAMRCSA